MTHVARIKEARQALQLIEDAGACQPCVEAISAALVRYERLVNEKRSVDIKQAKRRQRERGEP